jgi:uncharacterized protein (DUF1499 family)
MKLFLSTIGVLIVMGLLTGCAGKPPQTRGVKDGNLLACPDKPNCVSTAEGPPARYVKPLIYSGKREEAIAAMVKIVQEMNNTAIREEDDGYLWVECSSTVFGFVDDLEIYFPPEKPVVFIRSASRVGYSDLGVNRRRVEKIRERFNSYQ